MKFRSRYFLLSSIILLVSCQKNFVVQKTETKQYIFNTDVNQVDNTLNAFIAPYRDSLTEKMNTVVVRSEAELIKGRAGKNMLPAQWAMGNFVTDACLQIAKQQAEKNGTPTPDLSIFTWGSVRRSLPKGDVTMKNMYELMPFENEMLVLKLSGKQIRTMLSQLANGFDPFSGATVTMGDGNEILVDGKPIEDSRWYYVVSSDYLSFGGDDFAVLTEAAERIFCKIKVRDALIQYVQRVHASGQTLKPNYEQRIR